MRKSRAQSHQIPLRRTKPKSKKSPLKNSLLPSRNSQGPITLLSLPREIIWMIAEKTGPWDLFHFSRSAKDLYQMIHGKDGVMMTLKEIKLLKKMVKMYPETHALSLKVNVGFGGKEFDALVKLKFLTMLDLSRCYLTSKELKSLAGCVNLKNMNLSECKFSRTNKEIRKRNDKEWKENIFWFLDSLVNLEFLDLSYCALVMNETLKHVMKMKGLKILLLSGCKALDATGLVHISNLNLDVLDIRGAFKLKEQDKNQYLSHVKQLVTKDQPIEIYKQYSYQLSVNFEDLVPSNKKKNLDYQYERQTLESIPMSFDEEQSF